MVSKIKILQNRILSLKAFDISRSNVTIYTLQLKTIPLNEFIFTDHQNIQRV